MCFIDPAYVRKDSNKQLAVCPIVQQPQRSKQLLAQTDSLDKLEMAILNHLLLSYAML
jgi:hypothetical protein